MFRCAEPASAETKCEREGNLLRGESRLESKKQCTWIISSVAKDGTVLLDFDTFDLPKTQSPCTQDFVEVRNGQTEQAALIGRYCGPTKPRPVQSSGDALWVRFVTSGKVEAEVKLSYREGARRSYRRGQLQDSGMYGKSLLVLAFLIWDKVWFVACDIKPVDKGCFPDRVLGHRMRCSCGTFMTNPLIEGGCLILVGVAFEL